MAEAIISRVYDLSIAGYDASLLKVKELTVAFSKMDATKVKLNKQLQKKLDTGDSAAIQQLTSRIKELESEMSKLSAKKGSLIKETEVLNKSTNNNTKENDGAERLAAMIQSYEISNETFSDNSDSDEDDVRMGAMVYRVGENIDVEANIEYERRLPCTKHSLRSSYDVCDKLNLV